MKRKTTLVLMVMMFLLVCSLVINSIFAEGTSEDSAAEAVNIAVVAKPSTSYVSGDTSLDALNDGRPSGERRMRRGVSSYGNWPRRGTQWVQYDWSREIGTNKIDVYWWEDRQGVMRPKACRLLYWDGSDFVPVKNADGLGVEAYQYNTTTFDEVITSKLRLEIDANDTFSTGILEWKVYDSGRTPAFPPTVNVGIDRCVMVGGKTYLNGEIRQLIGEGGDAKVVWSQESGPGEVSFENANATETTATISEPGDYVLKLTAGEGDLTGSSTLMVKAVERPSEEPLELINPRNFKINSRLWNSRAKALIVGWIPH